MVELCHLAIHCQFEAYLEGTQRDHFVCESIQCSVLTKKSLSLAHAVELARCMEVAENNTLSFKGAKAPIQNLQQSSVPSGATHRQPSKDKPCYRCGKKNHAPVKYCFKEALCHHCQKKGRLVKAYRVRLTQQTSGTKKQVNKQQRREANWVQEDSQDSEDDSDSGLPLYQLVISLHTISQLHWKLTKRS